MAEFGGDDIAVMSSFGSEAFRAIFEAELAKGVKILMSTGSKP